ncbi:MAG: RNA-binding protein [Gammaproteobacteria bacterium]|nr:RNA-binding protein [Gammaproteobacteria bacterium]
MDIFIRRLPESVTRLDLIHFVSAALRPQWSLFRRGDGPQQIDCEIFRVTSLDNQSAEYHGIVHFEDPTEAMAVIERLNGRQLKGKRMEVRKYYHRSNLRDRRRQPNGQMPAGDIVEQRQADRRRNHLQIEPLHAGITRPHFYGQQLRT